MATHSNEKFEEFVSYCRTILKGESAELIKLIRRRYDMCNSDFRDTQDMVELLDTTTNKLRTEPRRQFVHLKDFLAELKTRCTEGGEGQNKRKRKASEQIAPVAKIACNLDSGSDSSDVEGRKIQKAVGPAGCQKAMSKFSSSSLIVVPSGDLSLCASMSGALQPVTSAQMLPQSPQITTLPSVPPIFAPSTLVPTPKKTVPSSVEMKSTLSPSPCKTSLFHDASALFSSITSGTAASQQPEGLENLPTNVLSGCNSDTELVPCCAADSLIVDHENSDNGTSLADTHSRSMMSAQETKKKREILVENAEPTDVGNAKQCSSENIRGSAAFANAETLENTLGAERDIGNENVKKVLKPAIIDGEGNGANSSSCTSDLKPSVHGSPDDQEILSDSFAVTNATSSSEGVNGQTALSIEFGKSAELTRLAARSKDASETADVKAIVQTTVGEQASTSTNLDTQGSREMAKNQKHIKRLEMLLEKLRDKIENIREKELTLEEMGEEDSSYIFEDRLQKKFVKVWTRLCSLQGRTPASGRPTERRFRYQGARFPEVNRKIERFVNRRTNDNFPDFHDIQNIVRKVNTRHKLGLNAQQINTVSRETFLDVGETLQKRRHQDFIATFNNKQTTMAIVKQDPALLDQELSRKLDENRRIGHSRMEEVINKYTDMQMKLERQDDDDDEEEEGDCSRPDLGQARSLDQGHESRVKDVKATNQEPGQEGNNNVQENIHSSMIEMDVAEEGCSFQEDRGQIGDHATAQKTGNGVLERVANKPGGSGFDHSAGRRLQPGVPVARLVAGVHDKTPVDSQDGKLDGKQQARYPETKNGSVGGGVKVIKQEAYFKGSQTSPAAQASVRKERNRTRTNSVEMPNSGVRASGNLCSVNKGSTPGLQCEQYPRIFIPVQQPQYGRGRLQVSKVGACGAATTTKPSATTELQQSACAPGSWPPGRLSKGQSPVNFTARLKVPSFVMHAGSSRRDFLYRPGAAQTRSTGKQPQNITAVLEISDDEDCSKQVGQNVKDHRLVTDGDGETVIVLDSDSE